MIDSSYVKAHQHEVVAHGENQAISKTKGGLNSKIHLAVNERGMPVKFIVTEGTRADCKEAINLLKNLDARLLFADRAYDTNEILSYIAKRNIKAVIPPKRNRLEQRD